MKLLEGIGDLSLSELSDKIRAQNSTVTGIIDRMEREGLVEIRPGKDGGVQLGREPDQITLDQIYKAVEEDPNVFALRPRGNPRCPVDTKMKSLLTPIFGAADVAVETTLRQTRLADLVEAIG